MNVFSVIKRKALTGFVTFLELIDCAYCNVDGDLAKRTNVVSNDESFLVLSTPGNLRGGSLEVVKDGMDSDFVDPKVLEGVNEHVSTITKSFVCLVTIEAITCNVIFNSFDLDKPINAKAEVKIS
nr:hypothetical protein [Tanacetum cinerariifolium]